MRDVRALPFAKRVACRCCRIQMECRVTASVGVFPVAGLFVAYLQ